MPPSNFCGTGDASSKASPLIPHNTSTVRGHPCTHVSHQLLKDVLIKAALTPSNEQMQYHQSFSGTDDVKSIWTTESPPGSSLIELAVEMAIAFINTDKPLTCTVPSPLPLNKHSSSEFHLATIRHGDFSLSLSISISLKAKLRLVHHHFLEPKQMLRNKMRLGRVYRINLNNWS